MNWRIRRRVVAGSILATLLVLLAAACFAQANPAIKTIKPAGGGDFTTLQAWEDWADDQTSGYQWAECYVGNLGKLVFSSWVVSPTAQKYAKVFAPVGQRSDGTFSGFFGAYCPASGGMSIDNRYVPFVRIVGLYIRDIQSMQDNCVYVVGLGGKGLWIDSCLVTFSNAGGYASNPGTSVVLAGLASNLANPAVVVNNVFVGGVYRTVNPTYTFCNGVRAYLDDSNSLVCVNNVAFGMTNRRGGNAGFNITRTACAHVVLVNNYSSNDSMPANNRAAGYKITNLSTTNVVFRYNASLDSTATNYMRIFAGDGCFVGVRSSNDYVDVWRNWHLKTTNAILDKGCCYMYSSDLWKPSTWRPRGYGVDIGAQEQTNKPSVATFESMFNYPDPGEAVYFP